MTVVILTYNELENISRLLETVEGWTSTVVVVDSGSTDGTVQIAKRAGATVVHHPFETHAEQWRWAIETLHIETEWVLALDADQRVTPALREELVRRLGPNGDNGRGLDGFYVRRRQIFRGRWIRHGGYYPKYLLKLFRRDRVRFDALDLVDHHFYVKGPVERLRGDLEEDNVKETDIGFWIEKHARYAPRMAREELLRREQEWPWPVRPSLFGAPDQQVVWLKRCWYNMPLYLRPFLYFFYRYFLRLGFLDGKAGFVFHFLHAFWYRLLIDVHLDELLKARRSTRGGRSSRR